MNLIRRYWMLLAVILIALIVFLSVALLSGRRGGEPGASPGPSSDTFAPSGSSGVTAQPLQIVSIDPTTTTPLVPGKIQSFTLKSNRAVSLNSLEIVLAVSDFTSETKEDNVEILTELKDRNQTIVVTTKEPIKGYSGYRLFINDSISNQKIYEANYISDKPQPSPALKNNLELSKYLPYETDSFLLYFQPSSNMYIFSFKYNDKSSDTLQVQYDKAKQQAIKFMRSKGIDLNSLAVEWRFN